MNSPHPTVSDLHQTLARYDREIVGEKFHTGRYELRYFSWGTGEPVLLVHGMCDTTRSFAMLMMALVDRGYRVIGYELANGKDDDANLGNYRHEDFVHDLVALLDHLNLSETNIMGSSFGSTVTLRALAMFPNRFRNGVVQGGFPRRPLIRIERGLARIGRYWPWRMEDLTIRNTVMAKLEQQQFVGCPNEVFQFLIECSGLTPIRAASLRGLMIDTLDLRPLLPKIRTPLLMIGGDRDALVPKYLEEEVIAGVPSAKRIEFQPCGHYPQYTMPAPMAEAMDTFFQE